MATDLADGEPDLLGTVVLVQEALGYFIGTLVRETPLVLVLGPDCVWVRDMGPMTQANDTGSVVECHRMPWRRIYVHAVRHVGPWAHGAPVP